ncbi:MAG: hypothetical protein MSH60_13745 [Ruminococcus sp.]|nr:hypothetical protein [Ruminococcus sp.]
MKDKTLSELNEKYSSCPVYAREYDIDNKKYVVHSHFVGSKDIDDVISSIAFRQALSETLNDPNRAA